MKIDIVKQARVFLSELDKLEEIKNQIKEEDSNLWAFLTPDIKNWNRDGLRMPEILRKEFTKAVDRSIEQLEKQIEEL